MKPEQMRAMLGRFGLAGQHHLTPICKLSGGQKARVVFTSIALSNPHILLLDEPTNHLDMQSIDALCDAIQEFPGGAAARAARWAGSRRAAAREGNGGGVIGRGGGVYVCARAGDGSRAARAGRLCRVAGELSPTPTRPWSRRRLRRP